MAPLLPQSCSQAAEVVTFKKTKEIHANLAEPAPEFNIAHRQKQRPSHILAPNTAEFEQINEFSGMSGAAW